MKRFSESIHPEKTKVMCVCVYGYELYCMNEKDEARGEKAEIYGGMQEVKFPWSQKISHGKHMGLHLGYFGSVLEETQITYAK